jgi:signal transduction histidine kinase
MEDSLFKLPDPVPEGAVLLGPSQWIDPALADDRQCRLFSDPEAALVWLEREFDGGRATAGHSRLVFLHQDAFAGSDGSDLLEDWLGRLRELQGPYLPILLHGSLPGQHLVRFFRAGLFDAIPVPVAHLEWVNMLLRAEKRLELRQQSRLILTQSGRNQELLRAMRKQLGGESASVTGELLRAQDTLEVANRQLTDAMAELALLYRFGRELSSARNWDKVLRDILRSLSDFVGATGAALILRSNPGGQYRPRQTWHWEEGSWDQVLVNLQDQLDRTVAETLLAPGIFSFESRDMDSAGGSRRVIALPLEHHEARLGFFLLMFEGAAQREAAATKYLPFLQAVQLVLAEEVASAQMLDRIRDIGSFNAQVLETVRSAIWVIDDMGCTVYCNRAGWEMMTGVAQQPMNPDEFLFQIGRGRRTRKSGEEEERPELFLDSRLQVDEISGLLLPALRGQTSGTFLGEGQILRTGGEGIPVLIQTALMPGRTPDQELLVVVAEDLRETRKLESERIRSDRLESLVEMSATLAHEIRNPLMGLSAQAELLADHLAEEDPRARYIEVITAEVGRINDTITRMLNYVRPYEPALVPASLPSLIMDSVDLARARSVNKKQDLMILDAPTGESEAVREELLLDPTQIKQVILNLLINAIDAAPSEGTVTVALQERQNLEFMDQTRGTRRTCRGLELVISDDGPGFKADDLPRIFRPFFTTKSSGTGLGLSISQKIISAHGGQIAVKREGERTVFRVLLPRHESDRYDELKKQEASQ